MNCKVAATNPGQHGRVWIPKLGSPEQRPRASRRSETGSCKRPAELAGAIFEQTSPRAAMGFRPGVGAVAKPSAEVEAVIDKAPLVC